jgi:hypothetical protein
MLISTTVLSFAIQFYVLKHLPIVDCLPYKKGGHILTLRKIPTNSIPDSVVITFVYKKGGQQIEFDADHFPEDFNDSLYTFVNRYDKVVRKGNAEPPIKDFVLIDQSENDVTDSVLSLKGKILIVFSKTWDEEWTQPFQEVKNTALDLSIPIFMATSNPEKLKQHVDGIILKSDFVAIKTAARVDPTIYLLDDGKILEKWALADEKKLISYLKQGL